MWSWTCALTFMDASGLQELIRQNDFAHQNRHNPVTAQTFKETIERTLNPSMRSSTAFYLADVDGAGAYMAGKADHISGVVAHGDTLTLHLVKPEGDFPSRIATPSFCAVPPGTPIDPRGGADAPFGRAVRPLLIHAGPPDRARAQPELPREPSAPFRANRRCDRPLPAGSG
jgi:hypothetical protein